MSSASRAFDQANGLEIDGYLIKISFSDHTRRPSVVGDLEGYVHTEENSHTLFIAFSINSQLPSEELLIKVFSRYGNVRAIYVKQTPPNSYFRPHVFVDYYKHVLFKNLILFRKKQKKHAKYYTKKMRMEKREMSLEIKI